MQTGTRVFGCVCVGLGFLLGLLLLVLVLFGNRPDLMPFLTLMAPLCVTVGVVTLLVSHKK